MCSAEVVPESGTQPMPRTNASHACSGVHSYAAKGSAGGFSGVHSCTGFDGLGLTVGGTVGGTCAVCCLCAVLKARRKSAKYANMRVDERKLDSFPAKVTPVSPSASPTKGREHDRLPLRRQDKPGKSDQPPGGLDAVNSAMVMHTTQI